MVAAGSVRLDDGVESTDDTIDRVVVVDAVQGFGGLNVYATARFVLNGIFGNVGSAFTCAVPLVP